MHSGLLCFHRNSSLRGRRRSVVLAWRRRWIRDWQTIHLRLRQGRGGPGGRELIRTSSSPKVSSTLWFNIVSATRLLRNNIRKYNSACTMFLSMMSLLCVVCAGKSFRHEKTKKKRGSYRGGTIDTQVYSIKFDSE